MFSREKWCLRVIATDMSSAKSFTESVARESNFVSYLELELNEKLGIISNIQKRGGTFCTGFSTSKWIPTQRWLLFPTSTRIIMGYFENPDFSTMIERLKVGGCSLHSRVIVSFAQILETFGFHINTISSMWKFSWNLLAHFVSLDLLWYPQYRSRWERSSNRAAAGADRPSNWLPVLVRRQTSTDS